MNEKTSFWQRLKQGLSRSSTSINDGIRGIFTKKCLDQETLDELHDLLIMSDIGVKTSQSLIDKLAKEKRDKDITEQEVREILSNSIEEMLAPYVVPLHIPNKSPCVILVVGVNGSGKTTTIGKLASYFQEQKKRVAVVAGDTFRAAAKEQLQIWAKRLQIPFYSAPDQSDPASLAFEALKSSIDEGIDVLFIDTAGRLHNKVGLMEELKKIIRVIKKIDPEAPHSILMVLDATIGQNTLQQVQVFKDIVGITGLVMTKLDGTAKGGVLVNLAQTYQLPIHFIGVGEQLGDLQPFQAKEFARSLLGLD